jgi:putative transposase
MPTRNVERKSHCTSEQVRGQSFRFRWHRFGPMFAAEIRKKSSERLHSGPQ